MLQRAASNACSWWWASHIRTKQSKWLEQSIQDMDGIIQSMRKLIEEEGDSFAKRAEMYYKRRPELIGSVDEAYKQYRALADRFDLLSKELQNANNTIATVFPEQVQFAMSEEEDGPAPKFSQNPQIPNDARVPQVPKMPVKELKSIISKASKQYREKKSFKAYPKEKSGLTKEEALEEISKIQKDILALQTVKEFVRSSYENGVAKYWGIENQIMEMQQKVSRLQDEFDMESFIEDDEARTLMAEAALKSCQEMLVLLEEKQENSTREAKEEYKRIEAACEKLQALRGKYLEELNDDENLKESDGSRKVLSRHVDDLIKEAKEFEFLPEKSEDSLDLSASSSLTVSQLAEKIDRLVNKVISLETAVSSQTVLVNALRSETDDLHAQIRDLEEENEILVDDTKNLNMRVKAMEEKLNKVQDLNKCVESQSTNLRTNFARAHSNLDQLSEKLSSVKLDEEVEGRTSLDQLSEKLSSGKVDEKIEARIDLDHHLEEKSSGEVNEEVEARTNLDSLLEKRSNERGYEGVEDNTNLDRSSEEPTNGKEEEQVEKTDSSSPAVKNIKENEEDVKEVEIDLQGEVNKDMRKTSTFLERKLNEHISSDRTDKSCEAQGNTERNEDLNWQQMLLNGLEDGEKILLKEYTTILRNYKDVKRRLNEVEKKERETQFDTTLQMRELKKAIQKRDEEILSLRRRLNPLETDNGSKKFTTQLSNLLSQDNMVLDMNGDVNQTPTTNEEPESKLIFVDQSPPVSRVEEKLRMEIDAILDENLDFWFRFSTAFHQVQKFKTEVSDLQDEISKIKEKRKPESAMKSEVLPIYKHLREIQRELTMWLEKSTPLKDELKKRSAALCSIQEDITTALKEGVEEEEIKFSSHQAAKLQGEILNMRQENNKVREELEAGLDHVSMVQLQIEKTLRMLDEEFGISSDQPENSTRNRVPLRSFIFGTKAKKPKNSIFSCMHPNKKYQVLRAGIRLSSRSRS